MRSSNFTRALLALLTLARNLTQAQFVSSLPECIQQCIDQSEDENCGITNIKCLCRASAGNFLPNIITCAHANCDSSLDKTLFLAPFQVVCMIAGAPIPESAIRNAQNQASSLENVSTTTVISHAAYTTTIPPYTTTVGGVSVSVTTTTVTQTTGGTTLFLVYPITIDRTTTVSGAASTYTSISTATPPNVFTESIPLVIISTDSAGSTFTRTTTALGAFSTYTLTNDEGRTVTQTSTFLATAVQSQSNPPSPSQSGSRSTSLAGQVVTTSGRPSATPTAAAGSDGSNGSPFGNTNDVAAMEPVGNLLGLSILLAVGIMWF